MNSFLLAKKYRTTVIRQNRQLIFSRKCPVFANENALPANWRKKLLKTLLIKKGGCFLCNAVMPRTNEYFLVYIERLCFPSEGWINALFSFPGISEKFTRLEVWMCSRKCMTLISPGIAHCAISGSTGSRPVLWARIIVITSSRNRKRLHQNVMTVPMGDIIPASAGVRKKSCGSLTSVDCYGI